MNPRPLTHVSPTSTDLENFWLFFKWKYFQTILKKPAQILGVMLCNGITLHTDCVSTYEVPSVRESS